jgi:hypothetical protein
MALSSSVWPLQSQAREFYGDPRKAGWLHENTVDVACPWPLKLGNARLNHILINKKCAESLLRVLNNVWDAVDQDVERIKQLRYDIYDGSYNYRPIRGGHNLSMHAYAAAIDWDAADNEQHAHRHLFQADSLLIVKFEEDGWIWGGRWGGGSIDAMHVQAARIHS